MAQVFAQVLWRLLACGAVLFDALLDAPNLANGCLNGGNEFLIHFVLVMQKPRAFLGLRHIRQNEDGMIEGVLAKVRLYATIGRERFIFQTLIVDELGFIDEEPRERERVGRFHKTTIFK